MKCPNCGYWNRASFPKCFKCGTPLPVKKREEERGLPAHELESSSAFDSSDMPVRYQTDESGEEKASVDYGDKLAREMQSYHKRKQRGEQLQQELRKDSVKHGFAPTGFNSKMTSTPFTPFRDTEGDKEPVVYDGYTAEPTHHTTNHQIESYRFSQKNNRFTTTSTQIPKRKIRKIRLFGLRRFLPYILVFLLVFTSGIAVYQLLIKPYMVEIQSKEEAKVLINASILDDLAAHTIQIPAPEGAQIYIKELRRSYLVAGGYATIQVPDYLLYEEEDTLKENPQTRENPLPESKEVTLTPFIKTGTGEQKPMPLISYTIDIPLSPLTLISPDSTYVKTSLQIYNIRFKVNPDSQVFINNKDFSSYVNTQDGYISYNANISASGNNAFTITVLSQFYRMNTIHLNIYRAVQDIPLELSTTMEDESSKSSMLISGSTIPGAKITVLTPFDKMNTKDLPSSGAFSFMALFDHYGVNTVRIQADYPGKNPTTIEYNVYYQPTPTEYTTKAWSLNDGFGYADLMSNLAARVEKTQVYVITGVVTELISSKPQLVLLDASDGKKNPLPVMLENQTKTEWVVGERYKIYADAYGMYNSIPRLVARYTYTPKDKK